MGSARRDGHGYGRLQSAAVKQAAARTSGGRQTCVGIHDDASHHRKESCQTRGCDASLKAIILEPLALAENLGDEVIRDGVVDGRNEIDDEDE